MKRLIAVLATSAASSVTGLAFLLVDELATSLLGVGARRYSTSRMIPNHLKILKFLLLNILIVILFYLLPTMIEWALLKKFNPWIACILFGDLFGCTFLAINMGLKRTAVLLYLAATTFETVLFAGHIISVDSLIWITDLLPSATILLFVAVQMKLNPQVPVQSTVHS